jgi:exosome complex component RRP4
MIHVKDHDIVTPGELLSDEGNGSHGTYLEGTKVFSKYFGVIRIEPKGVGVQPLTSVYEPMEGDEVVGQITEVGGKYWVVDINAPYYTRLDVRDMNIRIDTNELDKYLDIGDLVYVRVFKIYPNHSADVSMRGTRYAKLPGRTTAKIDIMKLPRLIGKEGTMINIIKTETNCDMLVGQNGIVWINGEDYNKALALAAVNLVEKEYYNPNLMDKIKELLKNVRGKV